MSKRGRPKSPIKAQNRVHSVLLSLKAELTLREENAKRKKVGAKEVTLSRYISERIIRDFQIDPTDYIKTKIAENNKQISELQDKNKLLAASIGKLREKKEIEVSMEVMD